MIPNPPITEPAWARLKFRYENAADAARLPEEPGLYLFVAADLDEGWIPLYVGQTGGLRKRMKPRDGNGLPTHENWSEAAEHGATYIHYRIVRSEEKRDELECRIWKDYQPPVNKKAPDGCKRHEDRRASRRKSLLERSRKRFRY